MREHRPPIRAASREMSATPRPRFASRFNPDPELSSHAAGLLLLRCRHLREGTRGDLVQVVDPGRLPPRPRAARRLRDPTDPRPGGVRRARQGRGLARLLQRVHAPRSRAGQGQGQQDHHHLPLPRLVVRHRGSAQGGRVAPTTSRISTTANSASPRSPSTPCSTWCSSTLTSGRRRCRGLCRPRRGDPRGDAGVRPVSSWRAPIPTRSRPTGSSSSTLWSATTVR